ncbi:microcystin-dependent protein [Xenococcus sp. PCC 7305]|uniref:phage tail protein n=1 Tax=Xenococcus sp. PCC 7305 TaxID=102125 RepID=UPI0002AC7604|nr:tail fiber protein [Xenococcus sp. PCC 7305]ELS05337.1 microcystin-dependent protein [Xenococcus sp. PCC 7305]
MSSNPFIGQVTLFAGTFAPVGWAICNGALIQISQNDALFSILGTIYGGDGRTTFALPDFRGRFFVHNGSSSAPGLTTYSLGQKFGVETVTITTNQLPSHTHQLRGDNLAANSGEPTGRLLADPATGIYRTGTFDARSMSSEAISNTGGSQAHSNLQPFLALNYIIALVGVYPTRN